MVLVRHIAPGHFTQTPSQSALIRDTSSLGLSRELTPGLVRIPDNFHAPECIHSRSQLRMRAGCQALQWQWWMLKESSYPTRGITVPSLLSPRRQPFKVNAGLSRKIAGVAQLFPELPR